MIKEIQREITPISTDDLFIVLNHPNAKFDYPLHYHPDFEINLVMNSYGKRIIGDSVENFGNLDLILIGPNLPHVWKGEKVEGNHVITIQFSKQLLNFHIIEKRLFTQIKKMLYESKRGIAFSRPTMMKISEKIIRLTKMQGFHTVLEFFTILHDLSVSDWYFLDSNQYEISDTIRTSKSRRITKVCDYIEKNLDERIKLADVADLVGMSESAFSHFFKKRINYTFIDYVNSLRISRACQMLTETTHLISEICYSCGFNNLSNFIRIFKKKKGMSPNEYRIYMQQMLIKF